MSKIKIKNSSLNQWITLKKWVFKILKLSKIIKITLGKNF